MADLIFRQFYDHDSSTYTYLLGDKNSSEAILIDSVLDQADRDLQFAKELKLKIKYVVDTHIHADHITGASRIKKATGALIAQSKESQAEGVDHFFQDNDELLFGAQKLKCLFTPGHTDNSYCFLIDGKIFTGDTLLIRACGRTDFQSGSSDQLFESVRDRIFSLPGETLIYPGHNYKGLCVSSVDEEKEFNPRLFAGQSIEKFRQIMSDLKLSPPARIDEAVPANMKCGDLAT